MTVGSGGISQQDLGNRLESLSVAEGGVGPGTAQGALTAQRGAMEKNADNIEKIVSGKGRIIDINAILVAGAVYTIISQYQILYSILEKYSS